ncbi:hypothetical protein HOLleu_05926 [Holothuria leucospilota]|uniref:Uncharacterized protein n=1 Tax=Holothuria leucospilota TaxID=206669 RepID=A0A9Q1HJ87_HOLLE|nr:hypothetical protein HOLleu_05926 [Holothuria leucospilota]
MVREKTLSFLVEVKGHLGSPGMPNIKRKNPIVSGRGQRSPGVTGGQTQKTLLTQYLKDISMYEPWIDFIHVLCGCVMVKRWTLLFLVEVKGHLGSPEVKKRNFPRIPKSFIWVQQRSKSKIFQDFLRSSSGVTRGQTANFPRILKIK